MNRRFNRRQFVQSYKTNDNDDNRLRNLEKKMAEMQNNLEKKQTHRGRRSRRPYNNVRNKNPNVLVELEQLKKKVQTLVDADVAVKEEERKVQEMQETERQQLAEAKRVEEAKAKLVEEVKAKLLEEVKAKLLEEAKPKLVEEAKPQIPKKPWYKFW